MGSHITSNLCVISNEENKENNFLMSLFKTKENLKNTITYFFWLVNIEMAWTFF
jgi:hypothetical protein